MTGKQLFLLAKYEMEILKKATPSNKVALFVPFIASKLEEEVKAEEEKERKKREAEEEEKRKKREAEGEEKRKKRGAEEEKERKKRGVEEEEKRKKREAEEEERNFQGIKLHFSLSDAYAYMKSDIVLAADSISAELFQNREAEIEEMAMHFLSNIQVNVESESLSNIKRTFFSAPQMFGSGKTSLGLVFLRMLGSDAFAPIREKLLNIFKKEYVDNLLASSNVFGDVRRLRPSVVGKLKIPMFSKMLVLVMLKKAFPNHPIDDMNALRRMTMKEIVTQFRRPGSYFFFHFDEIDIIPSLFSTDLNNVAESVKVFYEFWNELFPLVDSGHAVYFSGRSSLLFHIGRGWFKSQNIYSPNFTVSRLLLDPLKVCHIKKIIETQIPKMNSDRYDELAQRLFDATGGIPRLVRFGVEFLKLYPKQEFDLQELMKFFTRVKDISLNPFSPPVDRKRTIDLTEEIKFDLLAIAAFRIPLPLESPTMANKWGLNISSQSSIPFQEITRLFDLHIEKIGESSWTIIFPQIVLQKIIDDRSLVSQENQMIEFSPQDFSPGKLLEIVSRRCLSLRLGRAISQGRVFGSYKMKEIFPFLEKSKFGELSILKEDNNEIVSLAFPKMVTTIKKQSPTELKEILDKVLSKPKAQPQISIQDWETLLPLLQPQRVYVPAPLSHSSDMFITYRNSNGDIRIGVHFQMKEGEISFTDLIAEMNKVACSYFPPQTFTFVIVCVYPEKLLGELTRAKVEMEDIKDAKGVLIATQMYWKEVCKRGDKQIKPDWEDIDDVEGEVILLNKFGVENFLVKNNLDLFRRSE